MNSTPYDQMIERNLPRLLALFNVDTTDPLCGCGDRRFWAWKLSDFPNATFQGAALGLARLVQQGRLPDWLGETSIVARIERMIGVVPVLMDNKGALAEALPNEGSFCVTGLVLGDCVGAIDCLGDRLTPRRREALLRGLAPLARFLMQQDETHGIISNHLATTALGMVRWSKTSGDSKALTRAKIWIERIAEHASVEGWMREYGGADPGYQSWCTSSLVQIDQEMPGLGVEELLIRSFEFLDAFRCPDGSYANGCGSRLTRFLMAGGAEMWSDRSDAAARLAQFARTHANANRHLSLDAIDEPNLVPFFNDTVLAASFAKPLNVQQADSNKDRDFPKAGLHVRHSGASTLTINAKRGGWVSISNAKKSPHTILVAEPVGRSKDGSVLRAVRGRVVASTDESLVIEAELEPVERMLPSPLKFLVLRLLSISVFRSALLGNLVKQMLAKMLLQEKNVQLGRVRRRIDLTTSKVVTELVQGQLELVGDPKGFSPTHMASQGYWQVGDDTQA